MPLEMLISDRWCCKETIRRVRERERGRQRETERKRERDIDTLTE